MYDIFISYNTKDQQIADEIYRRLNMEGFSVFLATQELKGIDWAGDIERALEESRGFVIILSANSSASNEVLKEVSLATRFSRYIFPFMIDDTKLDRRMEYHLAPFQWISAVLPPMEIRYQDLVHRVKDALQGTRTEGNVNYERVELIGQNLSPRAEFTGREEELEQIHTILETGDSAVFLTGMGGIGKSELVRAYGKRYRDNYHTIVMVSYQSDLLHLVADDRSITIKGCARGGINSGQTETDEDYYKRKLEMLRRIVDSKTLLIIDNFDTEQDGKLKDILSLGCNKIFTTRVNFEELGYPTVFIRAMDMETVLLPLMEQLDHKYLKPEDRQAALDIIRLLDCHTYAVSLTASQMRAGHIHPKKMLEMLTNEGLKYRTRSAFTREAGVNKHSAAEYIRMLFNFSSLSEREKELMRYLCCSPIEGIDIDLFMELAELASFEELRHLMTLNWVQENADENLCRIHMLVRELANEQLNPNLDACAVYVRNLAKRMRNCGGWNNSYEENLALEPAVLALLQAYPNPTTDFLNEFGDFTTFAWVMNRFDESEKMALFLYELCVREFGEFSEEAGYQAVRVAAVYFNKNDHVNDRPWYQKGLDVLLARGEDTCDTVVAIMKVARSDMLNGDLKAAEKGFRNAEAMAVRIVERGSMKILRNSENRPESVNARVQLCVIRTHLAQLMAGRAQYQEAADILREQIRELPKAAPETTSILYLKRVLGVICCAMGNFDEGFSILKSCMEDNFACHGNNIDMVVLAELCGDALVMKGNPVDAASYYADALNKLERNFPGDSAGIDRLNEKYESARRGICFDIPYQHLPV